MSQAATSLGIEMIDVRIKRADYPDQTSQAIYARMKSERDREAREFRGEGSEVAQQIRADADRQRVVTIATAQQQAQTLRGQGDALDQQRDQGEDGERTGSGTGHAASDFAAPCQGLVE